MKKLLFFGLAAVLPLLPFMIGCASPAASTTPTTEAPLATTSSAMEQVIDISMDELVAQKNIIRNIELTLPGSLVVRIGANPSTGFEWEVDKISDPDVIVVGANDYLPPYDTNVVGAPGTAVWTFNAGKVGNATILMTYNQPFEGGKKDEFTLTINVTVK